MLRLWTGACGPSGQCCHDTHRCRAVCMHPKKVRLPVRAVDGFLQPCLPTRVLPAAAASAPMSLSLVLNWRMLMLLTLSKVRTLCICLGELGDLTHRGELQRSCHK